MRDLVRRRTLAMLLAFVVAIPVSSAFAQQTYAADRFVDAAGVNIHLHYDNTIYWNQFPLIRDRLIELGVRHVRDGLVDTTWQPYYQRHNALGQAGIKGTFIMGVNDTVELLAQYPGRMSSTFEAYEAANEYDKSGNANWAAVLRQSLVRLRSVTNDARGAGFPIYGPSLTSAAAYAALGNVSQYYDFANIHNYFGGRNPGTPGWGAGGYGSIGWNLDLTRQYSPSKPVVATETGYQDDPSLVDGVPPQIAGRYMPRVLLEQFRAGVVRTFLYELADFPNSGHYGLLTEDGTPKAAFNAVKGLLNLLADPGPAFTPRALRYTVDNDGGDIRHVAFQKRDGTYFLAIWLALPGYDPVTHRPIAVQPQQTTVRLTTATRVARVHRWLPDGTVSSKVANTRAMTTIMPVSVTDALMVIELVP
jgi:hypothetical protein